MNNYIFKSSVPNHEEVKKVLLEQINSVRLGGMLPTTKVGFAFTKFRVNIDSHADLQEGDTIQVVIGDKIHPTAKVVKVIETPGIYDTVDCILIWDLPDIYVQAGQLIGAEIRITSPGLSEEREAEKEIEEGTFELRVFEKGTWKVRYITKQDAEKLKDLFFPAYKF